MIAAEEGHHECVSVLVASGADVNDISKSLEVTCMNCMRAIPVCLQVFRVPLAASGCPLPSV